MTGGHEVPIRVLHVDDEPDFVELAATFLEREDERFEVETATSASEGLDRLARGDFDCVVSDYDMPGRNGIEFLETVREDHPDLPFVLFTGKGSEEVASEAISAGVTDYLQKESGTDQYALLANRVGNAVERYAAEREVETTQRRFTKLLQDAADYVHVLDADGTVRYVTPSVERILGYAPTDLEGTDALELVHPDDRDAALETLDRIAEDPGAEASMELRAETADGSWRWLEVKSRNLLEDPAIGGVVGNVRDVTERKERQAEVDWHRTVLGNMDAGIYVLDADHRFRFVDYRIENLDGIPESDWTDRDLSYLAEIDVLQSDDVARIEDGIDRILAGETDRVTAEIEPAVPEQTEVAEVRLRSLEVDTASDMVLATTRDVTRRTRRERKLERYETIVETIDDAAFVIDDDWTVAYANQSALDNVGTSRAEADRQPVVPLVEEFAAAADGADRFSGVLGRAFDADDPETFSERLELEVCADGGSQTFEYQFSPIVESGGVEAVAVTTREITERKERERKLEALHDATRDLAGAESHQQIADITVETARDVLDLPVSGVYLHDDDANVLRPATVTDEAVDLLDEIPVFGPDDSISWEVYASGEMRQFDDVSAAPGRYNEETAIRSELVVPVGEYGVMNIGSTEVGAFDETDLSLARILAANAEAAMERADRERELTRQNERLGEFASIVSHDLRNPLQVAEGRLELIREDHDSEHLDALGNALDRMERLIEDLLGLAREGAAVEELEAVDLAALAERCWRNVETADSTLVVESDRTVRADSGRLQQLLENLLGNAVEHGGSVTIEIGDLDTGFYVADDGPGIPKADRDAVFEAGYSTTEDGTGFGLSIVEGIADAHGWNVRVTGSETGGARFEITGIDDRE